ncbi:MAG: BACON domain-containing protein, partial [Bacteroidales bacterium]|nr:BACON domain-containing protein [Candidatus Cacconaster scatequi]
MKKILFALCSFAILLTACEKNQLPQLPQNPYRMIVEYTPGTYTLEVAGNVTPDELYPWLSVSQNGNTVSFTVRRNTQDIIRRAEFTIAGSSQKFIVNQKGHKLDGNVSGTLANLDLETEVADIEFVCTSEIGEDYEEWGYVFGESPDINACTPTPKGTPAFGQPQKVSFTGIEEGKNYYAWGYVKSTEGDVIYSGMVAIITVPTFVKAGENLQTAIDNAYPFSEIRVEGGATYIGPINLGGKNVNKTISGGWNSDFTEQSMDNLSVLNGAGGLGFVCAESDGSPMEGYAKISYFEVKGCKGDHGSAFHCVGGPITISNCYVHDCDSEKGAIGTNEGDYQTTLTVVNCIVSNNSANAHGPAFGFGEGKSDDEPVKATLIGNLIIDNVSTKKDGYASTFICYNQTELILVNNTIVGNKNWAEYDGPYSGMVLRGDVCSIFANNIMVGNFTSPCTSEMEAPEYEPQDGFLNMGGGIGTLANNIYEGSMKEASGVTVQNQID